MANRLANTRYADAPYANLNALMEKLAAKARLDGTQDVLADKLIGAARYMGLTDHDIDMALYDVHDGPVFYYP